MKDKMENNCFRFTYRDYDISVTNIHDILEVAVFRDEYSTIILYDSFDVEDAIEFVNRRTS